jgi:hypothetical protein
VGLANQRETTILWDRHTGQPLHNAVVWQDTRVADLVKEQAKLLDCGIVVPPSSPRTLILSRYEDLKYRGRTQAGTCKPKAG